MPSAPRNARADFAFSTTKSFSSRMRCSAGAGSESSGVAPSGVGMAKSDGPEMVVCPWFWFSIL
jgi:hypothetical protein